MDLDVTFGRQCLLNSIDNCCEGRPRLTYAVASLLMCMRLVGIR